MKDQVAVASKKDFKYSRYAEHLGISKTKNGVCSTSPNKQKVGVALFGLGRIGTIHFANLYKNPRIRFLYCFDDSAERRDDIIQHYPFDDEFRMLSSEDSQLAFDDPRVEVIVICTPTFTHEYIALKSIEAGKHVFCEKPVAHEYEAIRRCYEVANERDLHLLSAFNRRFDPSFVDIKNRVQSGEIGQVNVIKTCSRDSPVPTVEYLRTSGGIYHDSGVHDIDVMCWIVGEWPERVSSYGSMFNDDLKGLDDFDTIGIILYFPSGIIGMIDVSRNSSYGYDQRVEVFGRKGMLTAENTRPTKVVIDSAEGSSSVPMWYSFSSRYDYAYKNELDHFLDVVQGCSPLEVTMDQTLAVSKIASACEESARTGKMVTIAWDEK